MFKIRKEQMDAFSQSSLEDFEERMVARLERYHPTTALELGRAGSLAFVHERMGAAMRHGLSEERDLCMYLDLALYLGDDFQEAYDAPTIVTTLAADLSPDNQALVERAVTELLTRLKGSNAQVSP